MAKLVSDVPVNRIRIANNQPVNADAQFVLYWMIANRRAHWNFSLDRAVDWAEHLGLPLVIFEALRSDYRWASDRIHQFVIDGMRDNDRNFSQTAAHYYPYLEPQHGDGRGALKALSAKAAVVVSDDFPCFFLPHMVQAAVKQIPCRFELVDSNGLFPMRATDKVFQRAFDFRRHLQKQLLPHLLEAPAPNRLKQANLQKFATLPESFEKKWPRAQLDAIELNRFPIDHSVSVVGGERGGSKNANDALTTFMNERLSRYGEDRNQPQIKAASELSAYLHFGHLSVHQIFDAVVTHEKWNPGMTSQKANGSSSGWWGVSETAESFLDELITWRELGYNRCALTDDFDQFESLPNWAGNSLRTRIRQT
ncbi:MAG: deoxyribodipyrimidine photolyase [Pirellulaceae bacterium]